MIGDNIKRIRELKDLGLNELARKANMNASYLSAIEQNKKTNPSVKTLEKIATALDVFSEEFFRNEMMVSEDMEYYEAVHESTKVNENTIPDKFEDPYKARQYISMHKMFAGEGFDLYKMSNLDVLNFANDLLEQIKMVSYKYKK